ncbi:MAG TPA: fused MFS/spermidine synthase, partial [Labilithrix sp.]|nr:fused MFS/spermidine synthase [Labilithrix sp.]
QQDAAAGRVPFRDAVILSAASGFLVFACEVVFVHLLALVIGTSVYAFGLMLAIFLVCLSLGTPLATRLALRFGPAATATSCALTGIALVSSLVLWDKLPGLFVALGPVVRSWGMRELTRATAAAVLLSAPVIAMGTTFPLVLRAARSSRVGADVGRLTVANTLGAVTGSIATGFLLLPRLGSQRSLIGIALAYLAMAALARRYALSTEVRTATKLLVAGLVLAIGIPRWDLSRLTSGANVYFNEGVVPQGVVESVREDVQGGVTTVVRAPDGERTLLTNGKFEGNDGHEVLDNRGFVHLPVVFAEKRKRAMVIGLGTGTSAGTLGAYDFEHIDIVELAPAIVDAARRIFGSVNHHVLDDPRARVLLEDGRNVLLVGRDDYDVISIEVSSIWFAGCANLYNEEFYWLASKRLAKGGVLQQWFQLHHTNRQIVTTEIATLRKVFPHVLVAVSGHQGQILASQTPFKVSRDALVDLENVGSVRRTLENRHLVDYVKGVLMDESGVDAFIQDTRDRLHLSSADLVSTDDNLFLEYATPRMNVPSADDIADTLEYLRSYRTRETLPKIIQP